MSYLEHNLKTVPTGLRKVLYFNWGLALLLVAVSSAGFLMLYSVAGGSFQPWAQPQMVRFAVGVVIMIAFGFVPVWYWRSISGVAYLVSLALLVVVDVAGSVGMGAQR